MDIIRRIFNEYNDLYFQYTLWNIKIVVGRRPPNRERRSIRLGSYVPDDKIIRIHPFLLLPFVPEYFLRYIIYHEMLHAYIGIDKNENGRRIYHSEKFNIMEKQFPLYKIAINWQNNRYNLNRLLCKMDEKTITNIKSTAVAAKRLALK